MLTPHACHHVDRIDTFKGNTNTISSSLYWCRDCNKRCWEDGSDLHHYFDFKDNSKYNKEGIKEFMTFFLVEEGMDYDHLLLKTYKYYLENYLEKVKAPKLKPKI